MLNIGKVIAFYIPCVEPPSDGSNPVGTEPPGRSNEDSSNKAKKIHSSRGYDTKIFVVWLESFEDSVHFPSG